ncbi:MAG: thiamine biosynthesis protein ThiS [Bacteroidetes bacterium GWA2_30_7]|nr:MAG: thiamine biosynthesis protein ThiS [Bacteroidetes bacterium GWA2_30_7]
MLTILLNNRKESFDFESISISELLKLKNYSFKMLIIKVNDILIKKEQYETIIVKNRDKVDIIHLMSGG